MIEKATFSVGVLVFGELYETKKKNPVTVGSGTHWLLH